MATFNEVADETQQLNSNLPTTNSASHEYMYDDSGGKGATIWYRIIHEWDISALIGATINSAYIQVEPTSGVNPDDFAIHFFKMLRGDWVPGECTWNIYKTGSNWTTVGAGSLDNDYTNFNDPYDCLSDMSYFTIADPWVIQFTGCKGLVEDALANESGILRVVSRMMYYKAGAVNSAGGGVATLQIDYTPAAGGGSRNQGHVFGSRLGGLHLPDLPRGWLRRRGLLVPAGA